MKEKTLKEVEKFEERRKIRMENSLKKKDFPPITSAAPRK